jgi:hypothetical protein
VLLAGVCLLIAGCFRFDLALSPRSDAKRLDL